MKAFRWILVVTCGLWIQCGTRTMKPDTVVPPMVILNGRVLTGSSFSSLSGQIAQADVIFIGEIHNDSLTHVVEYELLKAVHRYSPRLAVSLEMFERDVQILLNDYLHGNIEESAFLEQSRPWGNYQKAYRPLVEFARDHRLPVLAMNVPRRYAGQVAMKGDLDRAVLSDSETVWIARELKVLDGEYRDRFMKVLESPDQPKGMSRMTPENLYRAQCLKDDTMAESIHQFLQGNEDYKVISYQGDFHSAFGLGVVKKLRLLNPAIRTVVVSIVPVEDYPPEDFETFLGQGDFLIFVPDLNKSGE